MLEILLAIVCMILIGTFWRKILPVAGIAFIVLLVIGGLFLLAVNDMNRRGVGQQVATDPVVDQCMKGVNDLSAKIDCVLVDQCIKAKNATWNGSLAQQTLDIIECTTGKQPN